MERTFRANIDEGTHLGGSQSAEGAFKGLLFSDDGNELVGQADFYEVEEDEEGGEDDGGDNLPSVDTGLVGLIGGGLVALGVIGAMKLSDRRKRKKYERRIADLEARIEQLENEARESDADSVAITMKDVQLLAWPVERAYDNYSEHMTKVEAQREFLIAYAEAVDCMRRLSRLKAAVVYDEQGNALDGSEWIPLEALASQKYIDAANVALKNQRLGLSPRESAEVLAKLGKKTVRELASPVTADEISRFLR